MLVSSLFTAVQRVKGKV